MSEQPLLSVVLLNYRRPDNLTTIIPALLELPFVGEVVVWDNSEQSYRPPVDDPRVCLAGSGRNCGTYGRFVAARHLTRYPLIGTQDDDYLIRNWPHIYEAALSHPDQLVAAMDEGHLRYNATRDHHGTAHECLLGWGSIFKREWIGPAFQKYIDRWGEDELLCGPSSKADRLFTLLLNRKHHLLRAEEEQLDGVRGPMAIYRQREHGALKKRALARALELLGIEVRAPVEKNGNR